MYFKQIMIGGYDDNFSYLIGDDSKKVAVVDPDNLPMLEKVVSKEDLNVVAILITHEHFDHISGISEALKRWKAPLYAHEKAIDKISKESTIFHSVDEGSVIKVGQLDIQVIYAPGHAPGCVCYLAENKLIVGDVLFVGGCGRCDLPGGDVRKMWETFGKLKKLPNETEVYPGHDYGSTPFSTIGEEKIYNRFFSCKTLNEFMKKR